MTLTIVNFDYPEQINITSYDDFDWGYRQLVSEVIKSAVTAYVLSKTEFYSGLSNSFITRLIASTTARLIEDRGLLLNNNVVISALIEHYLDIVITTMEHISESVHGIIGDKAPDTIRSRLTTTPHLSYYSLELTSG